MRALARVLVFVMLVVFVAFTYCPLAHLSIRHAYPIAPMAFITTSAWSVQRIGRVETFISQQLRNKNTKLTIWRASWSIYVSNAA